MKFGLTAVVMLVVCLALRLEYAVYALYVILGVFLVSQWTAGRWAEAIRVERWCSCTAAEIGQKATVRLTLWNVSGRRVPWMLVEEALPVDALTQHPPRLLSSGGRLAIASLRRGESRVMAYEVEVLMRGYYQMGPVMLETGDLFGLYRHFRVCSEPWYVLVRPRVVPLIGYDLASRRPIGEIRLRNRHFEDPTRIVGVRPYEHGDPLNRVHWRATARTGMLHSKTFEPSCVAGATLLLDFHRASYGPRRSRRGPDPELERRLRAAGMSWDDARIEGPDSFQVELAVTTAASLAHAVLEQGQQVGLVSNGRDAADRIRLEGYQEEFRSRAKAHTRLQQMSIEERRRPVVVPTRRAAEQLDQILDSLARLELNDGLPFPELVAEAMSRLPRDATVAAILTQVTEASALALGLLRRSGFAVTAVVVDRDEEDQLDWATPSDWAGYLISEGVPFRQVRDADSLQRLCAEHFIR
ncbi:MAG: DUF58 domain-containing protein [Verrucomicrobiales bacterium]|nr:DUF58 domain-containing protein [Verrucomicrobiales bacterium]